MGPAGFHSAPIRTDVPAIRGRFGVRFARRRRPGIAHRLVDEGAPRAIGGGAFF
jgi:hypothetical protein